MTFTWIFFLYNNDISGTQETYANKKPFSQDASDWRNWAVWFRGHGAAYNISRHNGVIYALFQTTNIWAIVIWKHMEREEESVQLLKKNQDHTSFSLKSPKTARSIRQRKYIFFMHFLYHTILVHTNALSTFSNEKKKQTFIMLSDC